MNISELLGKTLKSIEQVRDDELIFRTCDEAFRLYHYQDCCEHVYIEDICGDLGDLVGSPILQAEEIGSDDGDPFGMGRLPDSDHSYTWTFYKLATMKGYVTIRWYGSSNGYYSESVDFDRIK